MRISELNIYPIKSLRGIPLKKAAVEERGLRHDRRWMLVNEGGKFLTQREFPVMARIGVDVGPEWLEVSLDGLKMNVPFDVPANGAPKRVRVWASILKAEFYEKEIDAWFSEALGSKCRLAAMTDVSKRRVNPYYSVHKFRDVV